MNKFLFFFFSGGVIAIAGIIIGISIEEADPHLFKSPYIREIDTYGSEQYSLLPDSIKEIKVLHISGIIMGELISREIPIFSTKDYEPIAETENFYIVRENRYFDCCEWVSILEIVPKEYEDLNEGPTLGWANVDNPFYINPEGTRTINLPPNYIIKSFFIELNRIP